MNTLVVDPGGKNFAWVLFEEAVPIRLGYFKLHQHFDFKKPENIRSIFMGVKALVKSADRIIIERYISRIMAKGVSTEKLSILVGWFVITSILLRKEIYPLTASTWKCGLDGDYKEIVKGIKELGYLKKDVHFIDCLLMYCYITKEGNWSKILRRGKKAYDTHKHKDKIRNREKNQRIIN